MTTKQKQWQLYFLGYYGSSLKDIDGIWGINSSNATQKFQDESGIKVDGIFGTSTTDKSREVIDAIQDVLAKYVSTRLVNDGLAGPATSAALKAYQKAKGIPQTGVVDGKTWDLLMEESPYDDVASTPAVTPAAPTVSTTTNKNTGTWWDEIEYFTRNELKCKCGRYCDGFPAEPKEMLVKLADRARKHFGKPAHNVSCLRCRQHNANSGGVANSQHMYGEAMDIRIDGVSGDVLLAFFKQQPEVRYAYKINTTNVHFDIPKGSR